MSNIDFSFAVYPNPEINKINLAIINNAESTVTVEIINLIGEVVFVKEISIEAHTLKLNISFYSKGVYIVKMKNERIVTSKKLIVK